MIIRILFWIALGTAALSVLVSFLSWLTTSIAGVAMNMAAWWWLIAIASMSMLVAFFRHRRLHPADPRAASIAVGDIRPAWLSVLFFAGLLFLVLNLALSFFMGEGNPSIEGGQMVLRNHGRVIRTLSAVEFARAEAIGLRPFLAFSAFMAIFAAALLNRPAPAPRPSRAAAPPPPSSPRSGGVQ